MISHSLGNNFDHEDLSELENQMAKTSAEMEERQLVIQKAQRQASELKTALDNALVQLKNLEVKKSNLEVNDPARKQIETEIQTVSKEIGQFDENHAKKLREIQVLQQAQDEAVQKLQGVVLKRIEQNKRAQGTATSTNFSEGLGRIKVGDKWGFIDKTGKIVIEPQFIEAGDFSDGLAPVEANGKWGFIDKNGKKAIELQFSFAGVFSQGVAFVGHQGKIACIDKSGKVLFLKDYFEIQKFSDGLAAIHQSGKWGFVDKAGENVIAPKFDSVREFSEDTAAVRIGNKWGFINKKGDFVVEPRFPFAGNFSKGLAPVMKTDFFKTGGKGQIPTELPQDGYGYIDKKGNWAFPSRFMLACDFQDGLARVVVGGKFGFINDKGKIIIKPQFYNARDFSEGRAAVMINDKWGYIDKEGRIVIKPQFLSANIFTDDVAAVKYEGELVRYPELPPSGGKWGYIDKTGKFIWPAEKVAEQKKKP